jgi:hypothetical protein
MNLWLGCEILCTQKGNTIMTDVIIKKLPNTLVAMPF